MGHQCNLCAGKSRKTGEQSQEVGAGQLTQPIPVPVQSWVQPEGLYFLVNTHNLFGLFWHWGVAHPAVVPAKSGLLLSLYNWFISEKHNNYIHYICIIKICIICRNTPYVYVYAKQKRSQLGIRFVIFFVFFCVLSFGCVIIKCVCRKVREKFPLSFKLNALCFSNSFIRAARWETFVRQLQPRRQHRDWRHFAYCNWC